MGPSSAPGPLPLLVHEVLLESSLAPGRLSPLAPGIRPCPAPGHTMTAFAAGRAASLAAGAVAVVGPLLLPGFLTALLLPRPWPRPAPNPPRLVPPAFALGVELFFALGPFEGLVPLLDGCLASLPR